MNRLGAAIGLLVLAVLVPSACDSPSAEHRARMQTGPLMEEMCTDGTYFRECFDVSRDRCMMEARELVPGCVQELAHAPAGHETRPNQGFREAMLACMRGPYSIRNVLKRRKLERCANSSTWP